MTGLPSPPDPSGQACGVVITFHPDPSLLKNLEALKSEVSEIIVVDNGSSGECNELLQRIEKDVGARVIRNEQNLGIATALNIGIRQAIAGGYIWVATFDQDSMVTSGFLRALLTAYEACPFRERVAILSPRLCVSIEECSGMENGSPGPLYKVAPTAMTSGSLFRTALFPEEGFYDEGFFMDYVDYDFCLRVRKHGWKVLRVNNACLVHRLGAAETHSFFGFKVTIKSHSPWRRYHIMRNRMTIYRRYAFSSPLWCLYDFVWIFIEMTKIILFEKDKGPKFRNILKGFVDGLAGKTGALGEPAKA